MIIPYLARACILIVLVIPSILCCIFVLYHYLSDRNRRNALNNHVVIVIMWFSFTYEVTAITWHIYFYYTNVPLSSTLNFCLTWIILDYVGASIIILLMAWATIERHILIFHAHWFSTWKRRLFLHYLPLFICFAYPYAFISSILLSQSCGEFLDFTNFECGLGICLYLQPAVGIWDALVDVTIPMLIIIFVGIALIVRVLFYRYRSGQPVRWKKYRKMSIQVLSISTIFLVFTFPSAVMNLAYTSGLSVEIGLDWYSAFLYLAYCGIVLLPFACVIQVSDVKRNYKKIIGICLRLRSKVNPESIGVSTLAYGRTIAVAPVYPKRIHITRIGHN